MKEIFDEEGIDPLNFSILLKDTMQLTLIYEIKWFLLAWRILMKLITGCPFCWLNYTPQPRHECRLVVLGTKRVRLGGQLANCLSAEEKHSPAEREGFPSRKRRVPQQKEKGSPAEKEAFPSRRGSVPQQKGKNSLAERKGWVPTALHRTWQASHGPINNTYLKEFGRCVQNSA